METKTKYIRFNAPGFTFDGSIAELDSEYEIGPKKIAMVDFYADSGRIWCVRASEVELITEKEFFKERLFGKGIFKDETR